MLPFNAVLCLVTLGVNAATQRSGADHFANVHLSPARTSPFICLADILATMIWLGYGVLYKRMGFKASAKMLFKDFGFSEEEDALVRGRRWALNIVLVILFLIGLAEAIKLFAFGATGTAPWLQMVAAAMFVSAYIARVSINTLSRLCTHEETIRELEASRPDRRRLFEVADVLYDLAYSAQFHFWIEVFGKLKFFAEPNAVVVVTVLVMVTFPTLFSYFFPIEVAQEDQPNRQQAQQAAPPSHQRPKILRGRWSLANWAPDDRHRAFIVVFVIAISTPPNAAWRIVFIPLTAFAVVVLNLAFVSAVSWLFRTVKRRTGAQELPEPDREDPGLPQDQLRERLNPLLRTEASEWRNTVSMAFGLSNLIFACMYYWGVYDASKTVKPGWLEWL